MQKPTLLILAAGMGSRYGGLKQMDAFGPNGETIIDYSLYDAIEAGFGKVVFIVRENFRDLIQAHFDPKLKGKIETVYVNQELSELPEGLTYPDSREKPWGTAHAVWVAREVIHEPFGVINADDFYGKDSFVRLHNFLTSDAGKDYCVVSYFLKNTLSEHGTVNRGICRSSDGENLSDIKECVKIGRNEDGTISYPGPDGPVFLQEDDLVSMNMWGFQPSYFDHTEQMMVDFIIEHGQEEKSEIYIPNVVDKLIQNNVLSVKLLNTTSNWFGVTYPEDKPMVVSAFESLANAKVYPTSLW